MKMPENYPPMGGPPSLERQQEINGEAAEKISQIISEMDTVPAGTMERSTWIWRMLSQVVYPGFRRFAPRADRWFSADETCDGCGACAKICPVSNIEMTEGTPHWLGHCEQCFACLHWCPKEALQYIRSKHQPRYHHPDTTRADLAPSP